MGHWDFRAELSRAVQERFDNLRISSTHESLSKAGYRHDKVTQQSTLNIGPCNWVHILEIGVHPEVEVLRASLAVSLRARVSIRTEPPSNHD